MKWIDNNKEFPSIIGHYLIFKKGRIMIGWFNGLHWTIGKDASDNITKIISHWMPLPEPPTKD